MIFDRKEKATVLGEGNFFPCPFFPSNFFLPVFGDPFRSSVVMPSVAWYVRYIRYFFEKNNASFGSQKYFFV